MLPGDCAMARRLLPSAYSRSFFARQLGTAADATATKYLNNAYSAEVSQGSIGNSARPTYACTDGIGRKIADGRAGPAWVSIFPAIGAPKRTIDQRRRAYALLEPRGAQAMFRQLI